MFDASATFNNANITSAAYYTHEYKWIAKIIIVRDHRPEDFPAASATSCICWVRLFVRSICFCKDLGTVTLVSAIVDEDMGNGLT